MVRESFCKRNIMSAMWFSLHRRYWLSSTSIWFMRRLQKILLSLLPISEDAAILCVHVSVVVLSTRMSNFECDGCCSFEVHAASSTALHEKSIVACSKQLTEMRLGDLFFVNVTVWCTTSGDHCMQYQNLSSRRKALQPVRQVSPVTA